MATNTASTTFETTPASQERAKGRFTIREWLLVDAFILVVLLITAIPYFYAERLASSSGNQFMGVVVNIPDHFQYFSWMRESHDKILVPNQLTPETSAPLLFNFLWWSLGRIEAATGISYVTLYQITRLLAGAFTMTAIYWFCGLIFEERLKRWTAFLVAVLGTGFGWVLVVEKYLRDLPDVNSPFALYTAEPNTLYTITSFPHFTIATGLITVIFGLVLLAQRSKNLRFAWVAAAVALFLALQHSYDMFTIYGVIGMYGLFLWIKERKFPLFMLKVGLVVALVSVWPALQAYLITSADEVWKGVLEQFDNAGAWTPAPWLLPILMGAGWLLAIWAIDWRTPWRERDDTSLFVLAWFASHFILIYIPLNFQIHLLSGWQIPIGILATVGLYRRIIPWLENRFKNTPRQRLALLATGALLLLVVPTNLYLFAQRFIDLRRANANIGEASSGETRAEHNVFFLSNGEVAALDYLETQVTGQDVVLSSLDIGQFVPALTGGRSFLGHWAQTLDFYGKKDMATAFFDSETSDAERERILSEYSVDYVIRSPEEARLGDYDPATAPFLTEVYNEGDTQVYKVNVEVASAG